MNATVRQKLEAALRTEHTVARVILIDEALHLLGALEADARRWAAMRSAAVAGDGTFVESMGQYRVVDPDHPTHEEVDAAIDEAIAQRQAERV